jgi:hypothetical protein
MEAAKASDFVGARGKCLENELDGMIGRSLAGRSGASSAHRLELLERSRAGALVLVDCPHRERRTRHILSVPSIAAVHCRATTGVMEPDRY